MVRNEEKQTQNNNHKNKGKKLLKTVFFQYGYVDSERVCRLAV